MKIALITPGTGSYYCGVCMRDNSLAKELRRLGHDAVMVPMYLPLQLDEEPATPPKRIFFGGISTYLREKFVFLRNMPRWLDRLLSSPWLLRAVAGRSAAKTGGPDVAEMTLSMLRGELGNHTGELNELTSWLQTAFSGGKPDVVWLSTALQAGLAREIRQKLQVPVVGFLQGEDSFIEGLGGEYSRDVWRLLSERMRDANVWVAPSEYFSRHMAERLLWSGEDVSRQMRVLFNGIPLIGFEAHNVQPTSIPAIGYLARMIPAKGLGILVEAFIQLRKRAKIPRAQLQIAGAMTAADEDYVESLKQKVRAAGLGHDVLWLPNLSRADKIEFLRGLNVLSVPATYGEAFGMYVIEAMAAGVPVVQPRTAAFPELVNASGGGVLFDLGSSEEDSAVQLCEALENLILDPEHLKKLGAAARAAAHEHFSVTAMAKRLLEVCEEL